MAAIFVGTSGYSYTEWIGPVYQQGTKPHDFLKHYQELFPTVELNFSYYRMPTAAQLTNLLQQGDALQLFSIKAHESMTHTIDTTSWRNAAQRFCSAIQPLEESGKLAAVLLQFPYSFHYEVDRRRYLDLLLRELAPLPLVVEFRNAQWYNNRTFAALRERNVTLASVDLPLLRGLPPIVDIVTSSMAYIRLHGRNEATWWNSDVASRYDYLYSQAELKVWQERIQILAQQVERICVYFNNHRSGQAVTNAKELVALLAGVSN